MSRDWERRILAETERRIRLEDPDLARRFETVGRAGARPSWRARFAAGATSIPVMVVLLLLFVVSVVLSIGPAVYVFLALATAAIGMRLRRERNR